MLNKGEGVYFTSSYHRGAETTAPRLHIRIESNVRGASKEKQMGAPLTFLLTDEEAKHFEDETPVHLFSKALVFGSKSDFNADSGRVLFSDENVQLDFQLGQLLKGAEKEWCDAKSYAEALFSDSTCSSKMRISLKGRFELDANTWASSGLCGLIGVLNCYKFCRLETCGGLLVPFFKKDHLHNFKNVQDMVCFVELCLQKLEAIQLAAVVDAHDLAGAIRKLHALKAAEKLTCSMDLYLSPEEFTLILSAILEDNCYFSIFLWVKGSGSDRFEYPYQLRSFIHNGIVRNVSSVSMDIYHECFKPTAIIKDVKTVHIGLSDFHYGPITRKNYILL